MSKYNFYKLKKDEHDWKIHTIPEGRKVPFKVMGQIAREDVEQVLNFALDMSHMETDIIGIIVREDAIEGVIMKFLQIHFREK